MESGKNLYSHKIRCDMFLRFSNFLEWDPSCDGWFCPRCHSVVSWHNCQGSLFLEPGDFYPAVVVHKCVHNSAGYNLGKEFLEDWGNTQRSSVIHCHWILSTFDLGSIMLQIIRNHSWVYVTLLLQNLRWCNKAMEPRQIINQNLVRALIVLQGRRKLVKFVMPMQETFHFESIQLNF